MSTRHVTTDHAAVRHWVEERGGHAPIVAGVPGEEGILRVDIRGYDEQEFLEPVSWDGFFRRFDAQRLAFAFVARPPQRV